MNGTNLISVKASNEENAYSFWYDENNENNRLFVTFRLHSSLEQHFSLHKYAKKNNKTLPETRKQQKIVQIILGCRTVQYSLFVCLHTLYNIHITHEMTKSQNRNVAIFKGISRALSKILNNMECALLNGEKNTNIFVIIRCVFQSDQYKRQI